jgi:hypothetical protein
MTYREASIRIVRAMGNPHLDISVGPFGIEFGHPQLRSECPEQAATYIRPLLLQQISKAEIILAIRGSRASSQKCARR